jgi:acetylornithine deacetylase/succinyl-diaminopimelate desuccinylase-like protein
MKDMDAMMLAVVRQRLREQRKPARDIVLTFTADEEAGGTWGASFLVNKHPELFEGVTEAVGEVGGFSLTLAGQRLYLLQTAEKGMAWLRLTARGTAGHGSMVNPDNAVTELAEAIGRLGRHEWPVRLIPSVQAFLEGAARALDTEFAPNDPGQLLSKIGSLSRIIGATLHNTVNPTVLRAGYKVNVVPQTATAEVDGRYLPGYEEEFLAELDRVARPRRHPGVHPPRHRARDHPRRCPVRRDDQRTSRRGPGRPGDPLLPVGRHGRQVVLPARHALLRVHSLAAIARSGLFRNVSRDRRTRSGRRPVFRNPRPGRVPELLLVLKLSQRHNGLDSFSGAWLKSASCAP